jgi:hypothetical protein
MDVLGSLASTGAIPSLPTGATVPKNLFQMELPMGLLPLQLLTAFPPTGLAGLNWFAVGQPITGILKLLTYGVGILYGILFQTVFPGTLSNGTSFLMKLGPWYLFDAIQALLDPAFKDNGFQAPIPIEGLPVGGGVDGKWTLTAPLIAMIVATLAASGIAVAQLLPPGTLDPNTMKIVNYATTGGGVLLGGIGLVGAFMMAKPTTAATVRGSSGQASSFLSSLEPTAAEEPMPPQTGGSRRGMLPPLSTFADKLAAESDPVYTYQALTFLGLLLLVALGGFVSTAV